MATSLKIRVAELESLIGGLGKPCLYILRKPGETEATARVRQGVPNDFDEWLVVFNPVDCAEAGNVEYA